MASYVERLLDVFQTESIENLATMEEALLALERCGQPEPDLVRSVLRAAHTLKGNSATLRFERLGAAAHALEEELRRLEDGRLAFTPELITRLLEEVGAFGPMLRTAVEGERTGDRSPAQSA